VRPGHAADHSPPSSAAVMEEYSYTSTHPLGHTGPVMGSLYLKCRHKHLQRLKMPIFWDNAVYMYTTFIFRTVSCMEKLSTTETTEEEL